MEITRQSILGVLLLITVEARAAVVARLSLSFESNLGQTDANVKFLSRGRGHTLFLTPTVAVLTLRRGSATTALRMKLAGTNAAPSLSGVDQLPGKEFGGVRRQIRGQCMFVSRNVVGFEPGPYDLTRRLVIDPTLTYSTFLGGSGFDEGFAVAADSEGNAYVTGSTASANFPTSPGADPATATNDSEVDARGRRAGPSIVLLHRGHVQWHRAFGVANSDAQQRRRAFIGQRRSSPICRNRFPTTG